jgi:hypothetical protein
VHRRDDEAAEALTVLLRDPDHWLSSGESRSDRGSSCESAKVILAGRPYLLKRYDCRGILYRFKNAFRRSRALRSWIGAWGLLARGIAVAKPLVVMEERHGPLLGRSYILSEYLEEGQRMMDAWPHMAAPEKRRLLTQCAILLGRMNAMNMVHGDTNWNNILLFGPRSALQTALVDLDGCRPLRRLTHARALRDVDHFVRDMIRERNRADEFVECFLASWVRWLRPRQQKRRVPAHPFRQRYRGLR